MERNIELSFVSRTGWNLRNGKFWFIRVIHEIYAHTVVSVDLCSTFRSNWTDSTTAHVSEHMHRALILIENHKLLPMGFIYIIFFCSLKKIFSSFSSFQQWKIGFFTPHRWADGAKKKTKAINFHTEKKNWKNLWTYRWQNTWSFKHSRRVRGCEYVREIFPLFWVEFFFN